MCPLPLDADHCQSERCYENGQDLYELSPRTEPREEYPSAVHEVSVGEGNGEDAKQNVRYGQVDQELAQIGRRSSAKRFHNDDNEIAHEGEHTGGGVQHDQAHANGGREQFEGRGGGVQHQLRLVVRQ